MTRLSDLLPLVNLPDLISTLAGPDAVRGLTRERGGVICDPRPGHAETHPSFSVRLAGEVWRWKRHGGDDANGSAYGLLLAFGYTEHDARAELARLAGVPLDGWTSPVRVQRFRLPIDPLGQARAVLKRFAPLNAQERGRAALGLDALRAGEGAFLDLQRRGLANWKGIQVGRLKRDFITRDGRPLAHFGALALWISGPDGQPWGLKLRNLGTADELRAAGLDRYVYRVPGHGAPAWCSPDYGQADGVLLIEGELNGAAAARGLRAAGVRLDVQGLAGAGGVPHLEGLSGRAVYLYTDADEAGYAALDRLGRIATAAGASQVRTLPALTHGDYCDLAGKLGASAFGAHLRRSIEAAGAWSPDLGPRADLGPPLVPRTPLSGTVPSIWGQPNHPTRSIWDRKRGVL